MLRPLFVGVPVMAVLPVRSLIAAAALLGVGVTAAASFAQTGAGQCAVLQRVDGGTLTLTQEYGRAGAPTRYRLDFEADEPVELADGSRFQIRLWLLGDAAFADSAAQRLDEHAVVEFHLETKAQPERPAALFFSRGKYINIDLGLGKIFQPERIESDGVLETMDAYDRWIAFAEGQHILTWTLQDIGKRLELIDSGTIDLNPMRDIRNAALALLGRIGKQDLRTADMIEGVSITCA